MTEPSPTRAPVPKPADTPHRAVDIPTYHQSARREPDRGTSPVTSTLLLTAPAVLAAAALRPRSRAGSGGRRRG